MELHQLRYVLAVARAGNFSRAAAQCHVAQPSLSQQIRKLEDELGGKLFLRLKTRAQLTPTGEAFVVRAARILAEIDAAHRDASDARALSHGRVDVGVLPTVAPYLLPRVLPRFSAAYPGIHVVVHEDTTARLVDLLSAGEIDFAIASLPLAHERMQTELLFTEELLLALPPRHPLLRKRTIAAADLEAERFILMKEGHCLGDQVLSFCSRRDFVPQVSCRSGQIETIRALVQAGMGISLVPAMACPADAAARRHYRSLAAPAPQRAIAVAWLATRPPHRGAQAFLQHLRAAAGEAGARPPEK